LLRLGFAGASGSTVVASSVFTRYGPCGDAAVWAINGGVAEGAVFAAAGHHCRAVNRLHSRWYFLPCLTSEPVASCSSLAIVPGVLTAFSYAIGIPSDF